MESAEERYQNHLRYLAAVLSSWRHDESLTRSEIAEKVGISDERMRDALLAKDWEPSLMDLARIEAAIGGKVYVMPRNLEYE